MNIQIKESSTIILGLLFFSGGAALVLLLNFLNNWSVIRDENPGLIGIFIVFILGLIYFSYRLTNLKNRFEIREGCIFLMNMDFSPKHIKISLNFIESATYYEVNGTEGPVPFIRIKIKPNADISRIENLDNFDFNGDQIEWYSALNEQKTKDICNIINSSLRS